MSCYLSHMKDIIAEAGIVVTPGNRKQIDRALHNITGVAYKDCSATWKQLKQELAGDGGRRQELVSKLRAAVG